MRRKRKYSTWEIITRRHAVLESGQADPWMQGLKQRLKLFFFFLITVFHFVPLYNWSIHLKKKSIFAVPFLYLEMQKLWQGIQTASVYFLKEDGWSFFLLHTWYVFTMFQPYQHPGLQHKCSSFYLSSNIINSMLPYYMEVHKQSGYW